jgi:hypothetical protein
MYIDDCTFGIDLITHCNKLIATPINLGSNELVSINHLVSLIEDIAGVKLERSYKLDAPRGVAGRNSDNTFIKQVLGWEPHTPLRTGWKRHSPGSIGNMLIVKPASARCAKSLPQPIKSGSGERPMPYIFVSGSFDNLRSRHVRFLPEVSLLEKIHAFVSR